MADDPQRSWRGLSVNLALPFTADGSIDADRLAESVTWVASRGVRTLIPNTAMGEFQSLSDLERTRVVRIVVDAAPKGALVVPSVTAASTSLSRSLAEQAAEVGAAAVTVRPPAGYTANQFAVRDHYQDVAAVGLPVIAVNAPVGSVDLVPELVGHLYEDGSIVAIQEASGDIRRFYELSEKVPEIEIVCGYDALALEFCLAGAAGWASTLANVMPKACALLWAMARHNDIVRARALYRALHPMLRWDCRPEVVQVIKAAMTQIGRYGGPCRPPRTELDELTQLQVTSEVQRAIDGGLT